MTHMLRLYDHHGVLVHEEPAIAICPTKYITHGGSTYRHRGDEYWSYVEIYAPTLAVANSAGPRLW